jgi:hypothetical protein
VKILVWKKRNHLPQRAIEESEGLRLGQIERLRCLEVDHQLKCGRLYNRKIRGSDALEDTGKLRPRAFYGKVESGIPKEARIGFKIPTGTRGPVMNGEAILR